MRSGAVIAWSVLAIGCVTHSSARISRTPLARQESTGEPRVARSSAPVRAREAPIPNDWRRAYVDHEPRATLEGDCSYYADSLAGNRTANGERYDPGEFTAANRELPFGTVLRVTRLDTGASTIVRVNDRGPFGRRRRVLDLSRAAANELSMIRRGVARVRVEILEYGSRSRN